MKIPFEFPRTHSTDIKHFYCRDFKRLLISCMLYSWSLLKQAKAKWEKWLIGKSNSYPILFECQWGSVSSFLILRTVPVDAWSMKSSTTLPKRDYYYQNPCWRVLYSRCTLGKVSGKLQKHPGIQNITHWSSCIHLLFTIYSPSIPEVGNPQPSCWQELRTSWTRVSQHLDLHIWTGRHTPIPGWTQFTYIWATEFRTGLTPGGSAKYR